MKYLFFPFLFIQSLLWLTGCTGSDDTEGTEAPGGDAPVTVSFNLWQASVARDAANPPEDLVAGTTFNVYAYPAGTAVTASPAGSAFYTVQNDGTAKGALSLNRGTYDFYFVSNNTTTLPPLATAGTVTVSNGNDFMYTTLRGIEVQPASAGDKTVNVAVTTPFTRLGAQVKMQVKGGPTQPIPVQELTVNEIKLKGLSTDRNYILGTAGWNASDKPQFTQEIVYKSGEFTRTDTDKGYQEPWISSPQVVLPVDAGHDLKFEVNLHIKYKEADASKEDDFTYTPTIRKALLPGMTYEFEFTLKFYGNIIPADLTLVVSEYNTVTINSDNIGGDEE